MQDTNCLNCDTELTGRFCSGCGQKADTHRINAKHFIMHDLVHGVWHLDRGLLYTLKSLFTRPGYMAKDYIEGKRVQYYNIFYLILLLFPVLFMAKSFAGEENKYLFTYKLSLLTFIPIFALLAMVFFRRLKYNFFEHVIIAAVVVFWNILSTFFYLLNGVSSNEYYLILLSYVLILLMFLIPAIIYYQVVRGYYRFSGFLWRSIAMIFATYALQMILTQNLWILMRYLET